MNINKTNFLEIKHNELSTGVPQKPLVLIDEIELSDDSASWSEISDYDSDEFKYESKAPLGPYLLKTHNQNAVKHSQVKRFIDFKGVKRDNINIQLFSCEKPLKQKGQSHLFDMTKDYFSDVKILLENNDTDEE